MDQSTLLKADETFLEMKNRLLALESENAKLAKERQAERVGRIRAQQELRNALVSTNNGLPHGTYPMTPIGTIRSCFSTRNGTPRQPLLVPLAKCMLELPVGGVPPAVFMGLAEYSHCWIIYVFHANTDLPRLWKDPQHKEFRAKVRVPRLNGEKRGVLATRSPHRPLPIGLSVAKVEGVEGRTLYLSGADVVDGTPVLDIKPYLPFCDSVPDASAPTWVQASSPNDPLKVSSISFIPGFDKDLETSWQKVRRDSLYKSPEELKDVAAQVLSRDIRSVCQRQQPHVSNSKSIEVTELTESTVFPSCVDQPCILSHCNNANWESGIVNKTNAGLPSDTSAAVKSEESSNTDSRLSSASESLSEKVLYSLELEGIVFYYNFDSDSNILVQTASVALTRS